MASVDRKRPHRRAGGLVGCLIVHVALTAAAAEPEPEAPDLELLAYLGSWADTDEEWVAVAEWDGKPETEAPKETEPSEEKDDE